MCLELNGWNDANRSGKYYLKDVHGYEFTGGIEMGEGRSNGESEGINGDDDCLDEFEETAEETNESEYDESEKEEQEIRGIIINAILSR